MEDMVLVVVSRVGEDMESEEEEDRDDEDESLPLPPMETPMGPRPMLRPSLPLFELLMVEDDDEGRLDCDDEVADDEEEEEEEDEEGADVDEAEDIVNSLA